MEGKNLNHFLARLEFAMLSSDEDLLIHRSEKQTCRDSKVHIAFLFTHGFVARMILRSGVAGRLVERGSRVTIVSPNAEEAYFQKECQSEGVGLRLAPRHSGRIAQWFRIYRPYLLDDVMNNPALSTAHRRRFGTRPVTGFALERINRTLARLPQFPRIAKAFECLVNRSQRVNELLDELRPELLVVPNPFGREETIYLREAKELQIPVVCEMLSWDNITSKGAPLLMPDYFISWGPVMTDEIKNIYQFPGQRIYECGTPHFDVYFLNNLLSPRELLLKELNLPMQPYIFYGMGPEYACPNELEIVKWLVARVTKNGFCKPCSLVIRPHPQTIRGAYSRSAEELKELEALVGTRVALDIPPVLSDQLDWDLPKNDMYRLASLLEGCAMCLNANSTLCLDASVLDRPVVDVCFDGDDDLPYEKSARRGPDYFHMAKLLAFGGIRVAKSYDELEVHINAYLCNPTLDRENRMTSATQECGACDGRAAERVASTLLRLSQRDRRSAAN